MQIQVHEIDTEISGANFAYQGIHVGAVHVDQAAFGMHNVGDFVDLLLKDAQCIGIGEHQSSDILIHLRFQHAGIDDAAGI